MKIKIKSRGMIIFNTCLFILGSFFFLHSVLAYNRSMSSLSFSLLKFNLINLKAIWPLLIITVYLVFNYKKLAKALFILSVGVISLFLVFMILSSFSKIILLLLGGYLVFAYLMYQLLLFELELACYNPNISIHDQFDPVLKKIKVSCLIDESTRAEGYLINWDPYSAFLLLDQNIKLNEIKKIKINIHLFEKKFESDAIIVSSIKSNGIGIKFPHEGFWGKFYEALYERGLIMENVR